MTRQENWHRIDREPAVYIPQYNQRGTLVSEELTVQGVSTQAIKNIEQDAKGQRILIEYGNGTTTRYRYDNESLRLIQLRTTKTSPGENLPTPPSGLSDANTLQNLYYSYDPVGNITEIHDDAYEPVFFKNQQVEPRSRYQYDALYRLIKAEGRESAQATIPTGGKLPETVEKSFPITDKTLRNYTQTYLYDTVGNIKQMQHAAVNGGWTCDYEYEGDNNRLKETEQGTNKTIYRYDTHGSMLNFNNAADEYRPHWNSDDMIHHINLGGGGDAFYDYGSDKERSRKRIINDNATVIEERLYLGGMEVFRKFNAAGDLLEDIETYHLFDGEQRILMAEHVFKKGNTDLPENTTLFKYQYSNHLGSVGLEVDENGAIISYEEYHPYGTTAYSARNKGLKATKKRYKYTGMERDEESGISYHSARYYLPWLGRWGSLDPAGLVDGGDLYGYSANNPISNLDQNGTQTRGSSFIADFEDWSKHWVDAVNWKLSKKYGGKSFQENMRLYVDDIERTIKEKGLGSNKKKGTAINKARRTFNSVNQKFKRNLRNAGIPLPKGSQVHHGLVDSETGPKNLANNPKGALDPTALQVLSGQAANPHSSHGGAHKAEKELSNKIEKLARAKGLKTNQRGSTTIGVMGVIAIVGTAGVFLTSDNKLSAAIEISKGVATDFVIGAGLTLVTKRAGIIGIALGLISMKSDQAPPSKEQQKYNMIVDFIMVNYQELGSKCWCSYESFRNSDEYYQIYSQIEQLVDEPLIIESAPPKYHLDSLNAPVLTERQIDFMQWENSHGGPGPSFNNP